MPSPLNGEFTGVDFKLIEWIGKDLWLIFVKYALQVCIANVQLDSKCLGSWCVWLCLFTKE